MSVISCRVVVFGHVPVVVVVVVVDVVEDGDVVVVVVVAAVVVIVSASSASDGQRNMTSQVEPYIATWVEEASNQWLRMLKVVPITHLSLVLTLESTIAIFEGRQVEKKFGV